MHSRFFESLSDNASASRFNDARAYEQTLLAECGVAHTFGIVLEVVYLPESVLSGLAGAGQVLRDVPCKVLDIAFVQHLGPAALAEFPLFFWHQELAGFCEVINEEAQPC